MVFEKSRLKDPGTGPIKMRICIRIITRQIIFALAGMALFAGRFLSDNHGAENL